MFCHPGKHSSFSVHLFRAGLRTLVKLASVCILSVFAALGAVTQFSPPAVVYVNDNTSANQVDAFYANPDGTLKPVPGSPFATGGTGGHPYYDIDSIAVRAVRSPFSRSYLYATNYVSGNVSGFAIQIDGSLTPLPGSPFTGTSGFLAFGVAVSADGRFLFVGLMDYAVDLFRINADGSLSLVPGSPSESVPTSASMCCSTRSETMSFQTLIPIKWGCFTSIQARASSHPSRGPHSPLRLVITIRWACGRRAICSLSLVGIVETSTC